MGDEKQPEIPLGRLLARFPFCWHSTATRELKFHSIITAPDSLTLAHLRDLSGLRESVASKRVGVEGNPTAGAEEEDRKDYVYWIEKYVSLYESFLQKAGTLMSEKDVKKLWFQWTSPLADEPTKFYTLKTIHLEKAMVLHLYGAALRHQGYHIAERDRERSDATGMGAHTDSAVMFRRAAGVYTFLSDCVLPSLKEELPADRPAELTAAASGCLSACCLAEAQAVTVHRAMEKGSSPLLVAQLHLGVTALAEQAAKTLREGTAQLNTVSPRLRRFIAICSSMHEALASAYYGKHLLEKESEAGKAVALCDGGLVLLRKCKQAAEDDERWIDVISQAAAVVSSMRTKFDKERQSVHFQSVAGKVPKLPEGMIIAKVVDFELPCDSGSFV